MIYSKETYTIDQHIDRLKKRGLIFQDEALAQHYLQPISYYRLVGNWWSMQVDKIIHTFKSGSRFDYFV